MGDSFDVIMAAYPAADPAQRDFDALVALVQGKTVKSEGVILVEHAADGRVPVTQTGDHLGRKGLGWGGGVGLVVGLFSPPLLASIVVGGAAGALVGKFARHKMDRVGFGSIAEYPGPFPRLHRGPALQLHRAATCPQGERLCHRRVRQVAPDAGQRAGRGGSAWPDRIEGGGGLRSQFTHCIDVGPTVLEAVGLPEPTTVDGIGQEPMDGTSFLYTFADAEAGERHTVQYFEMFGSRAIYKDGWWACTKLDKAPWDFSPETIRRFAPGVYDPEQDVWELYYLPDDFSQARDLAAGNQGKLAELQELWRAEAGRNRVLPLLGGMSIFFGILPPLPTITRFTFAGMSRTCSAAWCPASTGSPTPSRPNSTSPIAALKASSSPTPTSSAGSDCGSTTRGY
jgi:hypothetical protein